MSPEEAKTKWCPASRVALRTGMAANRTGNMGDGSYNDITNETRCLADGCMAWVWNRHNGPPFNDDGRCGLVGAAQ